METPPRVWGRLDIPPEKDGLTRNTPTRVGKTLTFLGEEIDQQGIPFQSINCFEA